MKRDSNDGLSYGQLIALAIGGHGVNFNALQCLLACLIDQLELSNVPVDMNSLQKVLSEAAIAAQLSKDGADNAQLEEIEMRLVGGADEEKENVNAEDTKAAAAEESAADANNKPTASEPASEQKEVAASAEPTSELNTATDANNDSGSSDFTISYTVEGELSVVDTKTEITTGADSEGPVDTTPVEKVKQVATPAVTPQYITKAAFELRLEIFEQDMKFILDEKLRQTFDKFKDLLYMYTGQQQNLKGKMGMIGDNYSGGNAAGDTTDDEIIVELTEEQELETQQSLIIDSIDSNYDENQHRLSDLRDRLNKFTNEDLQQIRQDIFNLYGKVDELTTQVTNMETGAILHHINQMHKDVDELKLINRYKIDNQKMIVQKMNKNVLLISENRAKMVELFKEKANKIDIEMQLASKAEFAHLQRKASQEDVQEAMLKVSNELYDARKLTTDAEKNIIRYIDELERQFSTRSIENKLSEMKNELLRNIFEVRAECLKKLEGPISCAGGTTKQLDNINCLSCGTCCMIKDNTRVKIPLKNAQASRGIAPLVSMQVNTVRKSPDTMGYMEESKVPGSGLKVVLTRHLCKKLVRTCPQRSPAPAVALGGTSKHISPI